MRPNNGAIKLVAGNSNPALADAIAAYLATPLTKAVVRRFADMEIFVEIQENVRFAARRGGVSLPSFPISVTRVRTANRRRAPQSRPSSCPT